MFSKTFITSTVFGALLLATSAFAQKATIAGVALGSDSKPIKNAEIRLQQENSKSPAVVAKTDAKGQFSATGLPASSYNVALLVSGKAVSTTAHVKATNNQTTRVNLGGKAAAAPVAATQKPKRSVFVHPSTGSHFIGSGYQDEGGGENSGLDAASQREVERLQTRTQTGGGN
jgi:hypothetical protein